MTDTPSTPPAVLSRQTVSSNGTPNNSNPSPAGSPPLILAFLAIGIFSAAMIAVFGWRRVQFGRDTSHWATVDGIEGEGRRGLRDSDLTGSSYGALEAKLGERPILWEAWVDWTAKVDGTEYGCWDHIMPLAISPSHKTSSHASTNPRLLTRLSPNGVSQEPLAISPPPPQTAPSPRPLRHQRLSYPLSIFSRNRRAAQVPLDSTPSETQDAKNEEGRDVQVVVIIAMPSQATSRHRFASSSGSVYRNNEQSQYYIGVHTCPWPLARTTTVTNDNALERISQPKTEKELV